MRKFRKNDLVVLRKQPKPPFQMSAKVGSLAIVTEDEDDRYIRVRWLKLIGSDAQNQSNGAYSPANFGYANSGEAREIFRILNTEAETARNWTPPVEEFKIGDRVIVQGLGGGASTIVLIDENGWHVVKHDNWAGVPYGSFKASRLSKEICNCD